MWEQYQLLQKQCDGEIEKLLSRMTENREIPKDLGETKVIKKNKPEIENFHLLMTKLTYGKNASAIAGINDYSALKIIAGTGTGLRNFKSEKHFTPWLGLAPSSHQSAKKTERKADGTATAPE
jgi:transposase